MHPSKRVTTINAGGDDGWGLFNAAKKRVAKGQDIIELTQGEHDITTDTRILEAMHKAAIGGNTGYSAIPGIPALREAIAARVTRQSGVKTTPDNVVVTAGGQAALFAAHYATCDPGDKALFIDPYYATYPGTIRSVGAVPVPVKARSRDGFQPRPADISAKADGAASLLINSPNNPTGAVYSSEIMTGIGRVAQDHDLWLISDEVYDTQVWDGDHIPTRSLPDLAPRTIQVGSMSKSHAMTGSRLGWIIAPEDMASHIIDLLTNTNYGVPGFIQEAALFALNLGPSIEEEVAAPFRRRREIVKRIVAGQQVVKAIPSDGAMYAMLDLRATGMTGEEFGYKLLDREKIAIMPGESFGSAAAGHIRVALTTDDDKLEDAIRRLLALAAEMAETADA